ncbi:MAG TPA: hypothetical protein VKE40_25740 [Gemmataceae bacterium]|nr:hypothetical protein [Gemmataceae bacterium]
MDPPVVAAVLTLAGSILTLAGAVFLFRRGKSLEKQSINRAILAEIHRLLEVVKEHIDWKGRRDPKFPLIPFATPVYEKHLDNIGSLDDEIVTQVVRLYGFVAYLNALQALRQQYHDAGKSAEFAEQYESSLLRLVSDFEGKFDRAFERYRILDPGGGKS